MSDEKHETVEDIVADIRAQNQGLPEDGYALSPLVCDLLSFADRIEAAANRQFREGTKLIPHEEVDVSKMETTTPTSEKSSTVSNAEAMREALVMVKRLFDGRLMWQPDIRKAHEAVNSALAEPPRNCDMGTVKEQSERFFKFCKPKRCDECKSHEDDSFYECVLRWSQMQYEEAAEMKDYSNVRAVCFDCARKAGFVQKNKAVIAFEDECGICKARRPCTDLRNDWMPPKKEIDVK